MIPSATFVSGTNIEAIIPCEERRGAGEVRRSFFLGLGSSAGGRGADPGVAALPQRTTATMHVDVNFSLSPGAPLKKSMAIPTIFPPP